MTGYPMVPLGEILELSLDTIAVEPEATYRVAGVYSFGRGLFARPPITGAETRYPTVRSIRHAQLVYGRLNAWEGALAVVGPEFDGFVVSPEFPVFVIRPTRALPAYVGWLTRWPGLWESLLVRARGIGSQRGTRRLRVQPDQLLATQVPLPPLDQQRRIVERMDIIAGARDRAVRASEVSGALGSAVLEMSLSAGASLGIPEVALGDVTEQVKAREVPRLNSHYRLLGVRAKAKGAFHREIVTGDETKAGTFTPVRAGQFIYNRLFAGAGSFAVVPPHLDRSWVSIEFPVFDVDASRIDARYLGLIFQQPGVWAKVAAQCIGTTGSRLRWHEDKFAAFTVPMPALDEQLAIVERMETVRKVQDRASRAAELAVALIRSSLETSLRGDSRATAGD
jgi:type I restriction enzyme, S subunit